VCANLPANTSTRVNRVRRIQNLPAAIRGLSRSRPPRPFRAYEPELTEFPTDVWARVASRRLRRASAALLGAGHPAGYEPLRQEIAAYLYPPFRDSTPANPSFFLAASTRYFFPHCAWALLSSRQFCSIACSPFGSVPMFLLRVQTRLSFATS
jgi:hypothetical protein